MFNSMSMKIGRYSERAQRIDQKIISNCKNMLFSPGFFAKTK